MSTDPPVSIIVLNHNGREFLKGCLEGILSQTYSRYEVIFVDNGSVDGSAEFVRSNYPAARIIEHESNLGFAEGNNRGVDAAAHDLIVLVNNDVVVEDGWLSGLVSAVSEPGVAIASSLCRTVGIPQLFYERNGTVNLLGHNVMLAFEDPRDIFSCTGCSLIFRKSEFGHPFDPDYFAYAEDVYLGFRARFAGRKVRHTNESRLLHFGGGTSAKQRSSFVAFYQERNRLLNDLLFFGSWTRFRLVPFFLFNSLAKTAYGLIRAPRALPGVWKAHLWLLTHPRIIAGKRRSLQVGRKVDDAEVLGVMSCKLLDGETTSARCVNKLSEWYCRAVGLRALEHRPRSPLLEELRARMRDPGPTVDRP